MTPHDAARCTSRLNLAVAMPLTSQLTLPEKKLLGRFICLVVERRRMGARRSPGVTAQIWQAR